MMLAWNIYYSQAEDPAYYLAFDQPKPKFPQSFETCFLPMPAPLHYLMCKYMCHICFNTTEEIWSRLTDFSLISWPQSNLCLLGFTCTLDNEHCCECSVNLSELSRYV